MSCRQATRPRTSCYKMRVRSALLSLGAYYQLLISHERSGTRLGEVRASDQGKMSAATSEDSYCKEWESQSKQLKILVTGQVGSGKSALINTLIGTTNDENRAVEGDSVVSVTDEVRSYAVEKNGVDVVLYDTPGLLDPNPTRLDYPTLDAIHKKSDGKIDLLIVCKRMGSRLDSGDTRMMQQITEYLGESVWRNAVFVLTFANEVKPPRHREAMPLTEAEPIEYFADKQKEIEVTLRKYLHKVGNVSADIAEEVPVVPAGYDDQSLPECSNWYTVLWLTLLSRIKAASQPALLKGVPIPNVEGDDLPTTPLLGQQKLAVGPLLRETICKLPYVSDPVTLREVVMAVPAIKAKFLEWLKQHRQES